MKRHSHSREESNGIPKSPTTAILSWGDLTSHGTIASHSCGDQARSPQPLQRDRGERYLSDQMLLRAQAVGEVCLPDVVAVVFSNAEIVPDVAMATIILKPDAVAGVSPAATSGSPLVEREMVPITGIRVDDAHDLVPIDVEIRNRPARGQGERDMLVPRAPARVVARLRSDGAGGGK